MEVVPKFHSTSRFIVKLFIQIGITVVDSVLLRESKAFSKLLNTVTRGLSP